MRPLTSRPKKPQSGATSVPLSTPRLTLIDVAKAMGVSRATVSNAFNRPDQLSQALRERILSTCRELGYFGPDPSARALRRQEVREVAVVYHHDLRFALTDPWGLEFLRGVAEELDKRHLSLQLIPKMGRHLHLSAAFQTTADALIVHAEIGPELAPEVKAARKPLVLVDTEVEGIRSIRIDDRHGAKLAMAHALQLRPDRVLAVCFSLNDEQRKRVLSPRRMTRSPSIGVERWRGYVEAARDAGWRADAIDWLQVADEYPEQAGEAVARVLRTMPPGTRVALVAMTDRMALAVWNVARAVESIDLIKVVGFDDIPEAETAGLTTIRQNARQKGRLAVCMVLDDSPPEIDLSLTLVERLS